MLIHFMIVVRQVRRADNGLRVYELMLRSRISERRDGTGNRHKGKEENIG